MNFLTKRFFVLLVYLSSIVVGFPQEAMRISPPATAYGIHRSPRNPSAENISDGHKLITRVLWRIFDVLSHQTSQGEINTKLNSVETVLGEMVNKDAKLETEVQKIKEEVQYNQAQMSALAHDVETMKVVRKRLADLEDWQLSMMRQKDQAGIAWMEALETSCPSPFERVNDECFYVAKEEKLSWNEARKHCAQLGGDLASPKNLKSLVAFLTHSQPRPEYVWVGGSKSMEGKWIWSTDPRDEREMDMSDETWNVDLPAGIGNCVGLYEEAGYRAYDYKCEEKDLFICQYFM